MLFVTFRVVVLVYVGLALVMLMFQGKLIFPASKHVYTDPGSRGWAFEDLSWKVGDHTTHAWYLPVEGARGTILFSHGNAGNIADRLDSVDIWRALGFNVLVYDYGGYGKSTGRPSEKRCYEDIRAAWKYLTETRGVDPNTVCLFGRSLGGGPTTQLATEVKPGAVILESCFSSVAAMGKQMAPFLPVKLLVRHKFDNLSKVDTVVTPKLFIHSPDDEIIPYKHGKALFAQAAEPKQWLELSGGHNEGFWMAGAAYTDGLDAFLMPLFGERPELSAEQLLNGAVE
jgi:hypothetical protein